MTAFDCRLRTFGVKRFVYYWYLLSYDMAIRVKLPADIDGLSRYRALSILNAS
jgi:hypothetical protein